MKAINYAFSPNVATDIGSVCFVRDPNIVDRKIHDGVVNWAKEIPHHYQLG
jgi:hypothetical protein